MFLFLIIFTYFCMPIGTAAEIPVCNGQPMQFNQTANEEEYTWYPSKFEGTQPPLFPNNFQCTYQINVPDGWSARVLMRLNLTTPPIDGAISVQVVNLNNQFTESVQSADGENFYFSAKGGRILLATRESNVIFGFAVKWTKHPQAFVPSLGSVNVTSPQPATFWAFTGNPIVIKAETRVSLVITPPVQSNLVQYLRSVVIYDGPDWNSTSLGSAYQVFKNMRQFVSSKQYMTVQQLRPAATNGRTMLIFQDYENTKDLVFYQGAVCQTKDDCGQYVLDGSLGTSALSTISFDSSLKAEYVTSITGNGTVDVYIGGVTKSRNNLIASYPIQSSFERFPQEFRGTIRTFVLNGKSAKISSTMLNKEFSESAVIGRKGFISSQDYKTGELSASQNCSEHLKIPSTTRTRVRYQFSVREVDLTGSSVLSIYISENEEVSLIKRYTSENLPNANETLSALGDDFYVQYGSSDLSKGFYLDFEILKSSYQFQVSVSMMVICFYLLL